MSKAHKKKIAFLILAAGESQRMGQVKQLLQWQDKNLLSHLIEKAKKSIADDIFVVLGANSDHIQSEVDFENINVIFNPNWKNGIGSSLSAGINAIQAYSEYSSVLISLADQPLISQKHYNKLISEFHKSNKSILASKYNETLGVPAVFDKKHFEALSNLEGNKGAKSLILNNPNDVLALRSKEDFLDLDTPEEYTKFINTNRINQI